MNIPRQGDLQENTVETSDREKGLQNIAKAYLDVRDGKAKCVMIVMMDDELQMHTGDASAVECMEMIARANVVISKELAYTLVATLEALGDIND